jgi:hypothetical protein
LAEYHPTRKRENIRGAKTCPERPAPGETWGPTRLESATEAFLDFFRPNLLYFPNFGVIWNLEYWGRLRHHSLLGQTWPTAWRRNRAMRHGRLLLIGTLAFLS